MSDKCKVCKNPIEEFGHGCSGFTCDYNEICSDCSLISLPEYSSYADDFIQEQINRLEKSIMDIITYINKKELLNKEV